jgi:hypothetical protein
MYGGAGRGPKMSETLAFCNAASCIDRGALPSEVDEYPTIFILITTQAGKTHAPTIPVFCEITTPNRFRQAQPPPIFPFQ